MHSRTRLSLIAVVVLLIAGVMATARGEEADPNKSPARCATGDPNPEPGMQGEAPAGHDDWDCGVTSVGFLPGADGPMAVAGNCAYTGGTNAAGKPIVRVIDVHDPRHPTPTKELDTSAREVLSARITRDRAILVTRHRDSAHQEGQVLGYDMLVDVWDIRVCTDPQKLGTLRFPTASKYYGDPPAETGGPVHIVGLNPTATKVYGTIPLQEADITDLAHPEKWTVRDLHCQVSNQHYDVYEATAGLGLCEALQGNVWTMPSNSHQTTFSPDGSRLYIGSQIPGPDNNAMYILDMTTGDPRVVSVTQQAPGHAIDLATIGGHKYLLHSNEIGGTACIPEEQRPKYVGMGDRAWLLDINDETAPGPEPTSTIMMAVSRFENCGPNNVTGPNVAFHDVDDPLDSRYAVIGFGSAGFRIFDIRDPKDPIEVAYFNHGASGHTKPYIVNRSGEIWVSGAGGFWVLQLEPQVLDFLELDQPSHTLRGNLP
jgi:hypothetical protein